MRFYSSNETAAAAAAGREKVCVKPNVEFDAKYARAHSDNDVLRDKIK